METQQRATQGSAAGAEQVGSQAVAEFGVPPSHEYPLKHSSLMLGYYQQILGGGEIPLRFVLNAEEPLTGDPRATSWGWRRRLSRIQGMLNSSAQNSNHGSSLR